MAELVQVTERSGLVKRVPRGETPVVELHLEDHQQIVTFALRQSWIDDDNRKTVDWHWLATIATRLGGSDA